MDSSAPLGHSKENHNFLLQSVQEQRQEKTQIIETFGDNFVFFYGGKPLIMQMSGMLINTRDFNWKNEFLYNYENLLRGTKCVDNRARVYIGFDDVLVEGYMLGCGVSYDKDIPYLCPFGFQILVTNYTDMSHTLNEVVTSADGNNEVTEEGQAGGVGARVLSSNRGVVVEYLSELQYTGYSVIDPTTGDASLVSGEASDALMAGTQEPIVALSTDYLKQTGSTLPVLTTRSTSSSALAEALSDGGGQVCVVTGAG